MSDEVVIGIVGVIVGVAATLITAAVTAKIQGRQLDIVVKLLEPHGDNVKVTVNHDKKGKPLGVTFNIELSDALLEHDEARPIEPRKEPPDPLGMSDEVESRDQDR
jgi:hypothetical protein